MFDNDEIIPPKKSVIMKKLNSRVVPPEADSGSAVKNIWWIRSEKLLKVKSKRDEICNFVIILFIKVSLLEGHIPLYVCRHIKLLSDD